MRHRPGSTSQTSRCAPPSPFRRAEPIRDLRGKVIAALFEVVILIETGRCGRRVEAAAAWSLDALDPLRCLESAIRSGRAGHLVVMPDEVLAIDR